jgi:hypothetical protein
MMQSPRTGQAVYKGEAGICADDGRLPHQTPPLWPGGAKSSVKEGS